MELLNLLQGAAAPAAIAHPDIDPVAFRLGPFLVRWYALAYLSGALFAWWLMRRLSYLAAVGRLLDGPVAAGVRARDLIPRGGASWTRVADERESRERTPAEEEAIRRRRARRRQAMRSRRASGRGARRRRRRRARRDQDRRAETAQRREIEAHLKRELRSGAGAPPTAARPDEDGADEGRAAVARARSRRRRASPEEDPPPARWTFAPPAAVDEFISWAIIGGLAGGRLGYVLFYNLEYYAERPREILFLWEGGMSFHGGLIGVLAAAAVYSAWRRVPFLALADLLAVGCPTGLLLGRLANFVNGELYGRPSDLPWAVVFPAGGEAPRHPSQIYEALAEGVLLFAFMLALARLGGLLRHGLLAAWCLIGYAAARIPLEMLREPDPQVGDLWLGLTLGQWLSVPMAAAGLVLLTMRTGRIEPIDLEEVEAEIEKRAARAEAAA